MNSSISVVIATYNSGKTLEKCLQSIFQQSILPNIVIVDGGSSDETLSIIKKYENKIDCWLSEKDDGVFDAWNKGIALSDSEWICFIGSDDYFYDNNSLKFAQEKINSVSENVHFIFGEVFRINTETNIVISLENKKINCIDTMPKDMPFTHVGCLQRKNLFNKIGGFNNNFKICGDFEFLSRAFYLLDVRAEKALNYKCYMGDGGLSNNSSFRVNLLKEKIKVNIKYKPINFSSLIYSILKLYFYKVFG